MKKYIINIKTLVLLLLAISLSCSEEVLDKTPLDSYSDPLVWSDINLASFYLNTAYDQVEYGLDKPEMLGGMTDELIMGRGAINAPWNKGEITADTKENNRGHLNWGHFSNIRRINLFLANIGNVPMNYSGSEKSKVEAEVQILRGEALFLRAWEYHAIMRSYGGLPLLSEPLALDGDFSGIVRSTFEETVNFLVADCDEAASLLKLKSGMQLGRATREAAMALKSRVLLFAASDLTAGPNVASELVGYKNPNRTALWTAARDAAKAVMDLKTAKLASFGAPDQNAVAKNYFGFFKAKDISNEEVIWGRMFSRTVGRAQRINRTNGPNGLNGCYGRNGPMQQAVDSYEMKDGSKFFDHFTVNSNNEYKNISGKFTNENPYYDRDPRFYGTVLYDSAVWQSRFANLASIDPLGIYDRRTRIRIENGKVVYQRFGLDTRQGPVSAGNGCYGGYLLKKFMDDTSIGSTELNENIWVFMRYAEILLNYAEACLELGDEITAATYINMIRNRAGMPDFKGDITEAYHYERKIELFGEDIRWYDIRRWRMLDKLLPKTPMGIVIEEKTTDGIRTTSWKRIVVMPNNNPVEKMYWIPIESAELKRAPQLVQNPGY